MSVPAIRVERLSKRYQLGGRAPGYAYRTLRESLMEALARPWRRAPKGGDSQTLWALNDISFDVAPGEVVGLVGRNGAGKSTLLKVLSRITEPTSGRARIRGRVASLLEVGVGFHLELTGRENIFLAGSILGMQRREIAQKFDEMVQFAEVEKFLDTPVKRYSSGMYLRLAFAVAAHLEPEILVVDEVLAVGDHAFQTKCVRKMQGIGQSGRTVLFVSHNMAAVKGLCTRALWLEGGKVRADGPSGDIVQEYISTAEANEAVVDLRAHSGRWNGMTPLLREARIYDLEGRPTTTVPAGGGLRIEVDLEIPEEVNSVNVHIGLEDALGDRLATLSSFVQVGGFTHGSGRQTVVCEIPSLPFVPGGYSVTIWMDRIRQYLDLVDKALQLTVVDGDYFGSGRLPDKSTWGKVLVPSHFVSRATDPTGELVGANGNRP